MNKYMILPSNSDLNRGDQALVWETIHIANKAGCEGDFYMLANESDFTLQSQAIGINVLNPVLKHPGRKEKKKDNMEYTTTLIIKWGVTAFFDLIMSLILLSKIFRPIVYPFLPAKTKLTIGIMKECKACFVKGGGFIHSAGKLTDSYAVYYQLFHLRLAQSLKVPIYVMPNSFGPFDGIGVARMVRSTLSKCRVVTVRESISKQMLDEINVESTLYPDLGFSLTKSNYVSKEIQSLRNANPNRKIVAITVRPYRFPGSDEPNQKYVKYIDVIVNFSAWLYQENYFPIFVEHTLSETTHESDMSCINEVVSQLSEAHYLKISNKEYSCRDLKAIYSQCDYIVGTRFHSVIFSLSEKVPAIAITYGGNKGQGIMKDIGLLEYAISMTEVSAEALQHKFKLLVNNRALIVGKLSAYLDNINIENRKLTDEIARLDEKN